MGKKKGICKFKDDALYVNVVMTIVEDFFLFFDCLIIDIIRNRTDMHAARIRCRANMYGRGYQKLHFALFSIECSRNFEIIAIQNSKSQRIKSVCILMPCIECSRSFEIIAIQNSKAQRIKSVCILMPSIECSSK